jgi:hypothetical protein
MPSFRQGNEMFRAFLETMLASESIDFWNSVEVFRKVSLENPAKLHGRAMAIYEQYLLFECVFVYLFVIWDGGLAGCLFVIFRIINPIISLSAAFLILTLSRRDLGFTYYLGNGSSCPFICAQFYQIC